MNTTTTTPNKQAVRRVGEAVRQRRESLGLSQDLSPHGGPKRNAVGALETRGEWPRLATTRARWAKALRWEPDAFDRLLAGQAPENLHSTSMSPEELGESFDALIRVLVDLRNRAVQES